MVSTNAVEKQQLLANWQKHLVSITLAQIQFGEKIKILDAGLRALKYKNEGNTLKHWNLIKHYSENPSNPIPIF